MTRRHLAPVERPELTTAEKLAAALDRCETMAVERPDVAVMLAAARLAVANVGTDDLGPSPSIAQVYRQREVRLTFAELARLVAPVETAPDVGDDPELERLVAAIREMG